MGGARHIPRPCWAALCLVAILLAACAGETDPRQPLAEALAKIGFSKAERLGNKHRLIMEKPANGLTISVLLPLPLQPEAKPEGVARRQVAAMILVNGPQGVSGPEHDRVYLSNRDLHRAIAALSQGAYPSAAAAEILGEAHKSAQSDTGTGATMTSPKQGYGVTVLYQQRHLTKAVVIRYPDLRDKPPGSGQ